MIELLTKNPRIRKVAIVVCCQLSILLAGLAVAVLTLFDKVSAESAFGDYFWLGYAIVGIVIMIGIIATVAWKEVAKERRHSAEGGE